MAEISALTFELNIRAEGLESELKNIKSAVSSVFSSLDGSGNKVGSTFDGIINQLRLMTEQLVAAGRGVSTLDSSGTDGLSARFDQANESLNHLHESLAVFQNLSLEISIELPVINVSQAEGSINSLRNSFRGIEDEIGNSGLAGFINQIAEAMGRLNQNNPEIIQTMAIVGGISLALLNLAATIGTVITTFNSLSTINTAATVGRLVTGLTPLVFAIIFAIAGITAGVVTLIQNWDGLVMAAEITWEENIVPIIDSAGQAIANILNAIGQYIEETFYNAVNYVSEQWTRLINFLRDNVPLAGRLIDALTPDPEAMQNHPMIVSLRENEALRNDGLMGPFGPMPPQQPNQVSIFWATGNQQMRDETEQTTEAVENLNEEVVKTGEEVEKTGVKIKLTTGVLSTFEGGTGGVVGRVNQLTDGLGKQTGQFDANRQAVDENTKKLKEAEEQAKKAEEALKKFEDLELDLELDLLGDSEKLKRELQSRLEEIQRLGEEAGVTQERIVQAQEKEILRSAEAITKALNQEEIERLKNSDSFFDQMKGGFAEFASQVESNGELISQFFANTLSEMSQNFSDLFFNVLTGKFDNLKDLAKQAFEAILRAFLDMVAAIATRQIVISIAGAIGIGAKGASATDYLGLGKQAAGLGSDLAGLFGGGGSSAAAIGGGAAAIGGGAGSTIGAIGAGIGGISSAGASVGGVMTAGAQAGTFFTPAMEASIMGTGPLVEAGGGILATIGTAATVVGAVIAAAALAYTFLAPLFKKTPRFAFKFESVETEVGERAALVKDFLDADFFSEEIFKKIVGRGGGGAFSGKEVDELKKAIQEAIAGTIKDIQAIINKLPQDMAEFLNEALLNTAVDTETKIGRSNLLGFDAKGSKNIKEKLEKFFQGDLQGRFIFAVRDFFQIAFEQLGVLPEKASAFIDAEFERFKNAGSPEERAAIGQEFLASFNAFVDAFNIVSGNVNDAIGQTLQNINALSSDLGFKAVPSIGELREELGKLLENAEIDAETVQAYADLRNAIVSLMSEITSAITGLIGKINQLNTTIVSLGGSAVDTTGFLNTAATQLQDFLGANMGNLSLSEQEGFLDQLLGIANDMLAQEQAAFEQAQQAAREAAEKAAEAQRAAVQQRIDGLNAEKERIEETFNARIEALNEELRIAEGFAQLTESIRRTLDSILYSPESVLTGVEQVNALQTNVAALQQELAGTTDPERQMEIAGQLEEAFKTLFGAAGDAFGVNSPEYVAIFDQVTGGLTGLAEMTESRARTVEEINAEIERLTAEQNGRLESIDAKIEAAQEQLSAIGTQEVEATFQASDRVKELFEYIRTEYMRILEERFAQLEEASVTGFATELEGLQAIAGTAEESLVTLKEQMAEAVTQTGQLTKIADFLGALNGYDGGSGGLKDFGRGTLAVLHGKEAVVTEAQVRAMKKHMALAAEMTGGLGGALGGALETFAESIEGAGPIGRLERELVGAGRLTELADRIGTARITSMMEEFAGTSAGAGGLVERLAEKLSAEDGHISGLARRAAVEEVKNEMSVAISVNVNGGSGATVASIGNEIENMLVRSIKQGGKLRSAIQDAGAKRMG